MNQYISMDNLRFTLYEVLKTEALCDLPRFKDFDKSSFEILLDSAKAFSDKTLFPSFKKMDEQPAYYKDGEIIVPEEVLEVMKYAGETGSIGATFDYEHGGMQLPHTIGNALTHISISANNHLPGYPGLTHGAAHLIVSFGSKTLIDTYVPNMMKGKWQGTMCLTEPQAGSSLSDISTSAKLNDDGSYQIVGQKIFISGGDYKNVDNVVHLLLARIKGAPIGTKGISLFVVPKKRITADNQLENNDVITAGDFQKMGQKAYCTTHLVFGENEDCKGFLVGEEHKGLKYMFQMMNAARIDVGLTGASIATAAYHASFNYANERSQGRRILNDGKKNVEENQTLIVKHPDVRRMLLLQKAITEGSIALLMQASLYHDLSTAGMEEERAKYHQLLEILTPIAKTYPTEMAVVAINNGLQVLGGYGFCSDFPLQQYYRDVRITPIYEGTTGIQSLDLLGRKITMNNGEALKLLSNEIITSIKDASIYDELKPYCSQLQMALKDLQEVLTELLKFAFKGEYEKFIADATIFMEMAGTIVIAWQWLKMATVAKLQLLNANGSFKPSFYESKIHTMKFFYKYELPKIQAQKITLLNKECLTILEENSVLS